MTRTIIKELRLLGETSGIPNIWDKEWRTTIKVFNARDGFFMELHPTGKHVIIARLDADPNDPKDPRREVAGISAVNTFWVKMPDSELPYTLPPTQYISNPPSRGEQPPAPAMTAAVPAKPGRKPGGKNG